METTSQSAAVENTYDVIAEMQRAGSHFWDEATVRFFNSKLESSTALVSADGARVYFITSERFDDFPRRYSVRCWDRQRRRVDTVGEFQQYGAKADADDAIYRIVAERNVDANLDGAA